MDVVGMVRVCVFVTVCGVAELMVWDKSLESQVKRMQYLLRYHDRFLLLTFMLLG